MNWIKENKLLSILIGIVLLFVIIIVCIMLKLLSGNNTSEYGDRLDGIEKVQISKKTTDKLIKELKAEEKIKDVTYVRDGKKQQGRLISVILEIENATVDEAKELGNKVLTYFDDEEKAFYDIQVYLDNVDEKNKEFPIIGYKHKTSEALVWD